MNIKETVSVLNQMQDDGVIGPYALGGAVAANLYLEPTDTADLDVFVALESAGGQTMVTLEPIYTYLRSIGYEIGDRGDIVVAGWPIQFLPVGSDNLLKEALQSRLKKDID